MYTLQTHLFFHISDTALLFGIFVSHKTVKGSDKLLIILL